MSMTPAVPGSDLIPDASFGEKVRGAAFSSGASEAPVASVSPKATDSEKLADIQARLRDETARRARGDHRRGRRL